MRREDNAQRGGVGGGELLQEGSGGDCEEIVS